MQPICLGQGSRGGDRPQIFGGNNATTLVSCSPHLLCMLLRLQKYNFKLKYKPGKEILIADTLSRACIKDTTTDRMEEELSCAVNRVLNNSSVSDVWLQEIKET